MSFLNSNNEPKFDFMLQGLFHHVFYSSGPLIVGGLRQEVKNGLFVSEEG